MSQSLLISAAINHLNRNTPKKKLITESVQEGIILLTEELSDRHRKIIDNMPDTDYRVKKAHDEVFGEGVDEQDIPYSREGEEKVTSNNFNKLIKTGGWGHQHHQFVLNHLHRHNYVVTDYVGGYAKKMDAPDGKEEKIGKILAKTDGNNLQTLIDSKPKYKTTVNEHGDTVYAKDKKGNKIIVSEGKPLSISQAFANDPIRAAKKDVRLVVTRSKEGVAGMSTGKGWRSCMNLDDGCNRHYVPRDVEQGTLTAYLVKKGDTNFDSPVGRVNLKQFSNAEGHKIFRPEDAVYGAMPQAALHAIKNWSETRYPAKEDSIYSKHAALYNDDGKSTIITGNPEFQKSHNIIRDHVGKIMDAVEEHNDNLIDKHGMMDQEPEEAEYKIHHYLNELPETLRKNLAIHHTLTQEDDPKDMYDPDKGIDDHIGHWASNQRIDVKSLSDNDLMHHLHTAEEASDRSRRYDTEQLSDATATHAKLIGEAMNRGNQELKDKVISHLVNHYDHPDNKDWYDNMNDEDYQHIPHLHTHTKNSNLLHKLYHVGKEGNIPQLVESIDDMGSGAQHDFAHAIGKHGDDDLLKEFTTHEYPVFSESGDHHILSGFHKGLNERPDSEEMQHKLIGELNIGGGHTTHGSSLPISYRGDIVNTRLTQHHEGGFEHPGNNELYANMAYYTKHPSVHQALKTRNDTQTPEIQDAVKQNVNGLK